MFALPCSMLDADENVRIEEIQKFNSGFYDLHLTKTRDYDKLKKLYPRSAPINIPIVKASYKSEPPCLKLNKKSYKKHQLSPKTKKALFDILQNY